MGKTRVRSSQNTRASRSSNPQHARVFWTGRSQAVRLPKEFRFTTAEVIIHRDGHRVILEPIEVPRDAKGWPTAWWSLAGIAPDFNLGNRKRPHERGDVLTSL